MVRARRGAAADPLPHRAGRPRARPRRRGRSGSDRHFVEHARRSVDRPRQAPAGDARERRAEGGGADVPHRRLRLPLRREHRPHRRLRAGGRDAARAARRRPLRRLQVHVLRPRPGADQAGHRREEARRRRRRRLLAAHAREDLPPRRAPPRASTRSSCEMANIREHCSWIHEDRERGHRQGIDLGRIIVEKVKRNVPLATIRIPVERRALVIGGGIAGIQAALDIADGGAEVVLVEKEPSIGGHMSQLSETFPTLDCSQCILTPRMVEVVPAPAHQAPDLQRGRVGRGLHRQLQGQDPAEGAQRRRDEVQRLRRLPEGLPEQEDPHRVRRRASGSGPRSTCRSRRRCPTSRSSTAPTARYFKGQGQGRQEGRLRQVPRGLRARGRSTSTSRTRFVTEKVGAIVVATGYQLYSIGKEQPAGLTRLRRVRLRHDPRRHRRPAVRAAGLGLRADRRQDPAPLRRQGAEDGSSSCSASARATRPRASSTARRSAACTSPSTRCSTSTRCTTARRPSSTWTSAPAARATTSSCGAPSRRTARATCAAASRASYRDGDVIKVHGVRHALRRAGGDRRRHGGAGHRDAAAAGDRGAGAEALGLLRPARLLQRGAPQAAPGGDEHRRRLRGRRLPGAARHPRLGGHGQRHGRQGPRAVQQGRAGARADRGAGRRRRSAPAASTASGSAPTAPSSARRSATARATSSRSWPRSTRASARAAAPARPPARRRAWSSPASPTSRSTRRSTPSARC